MKGYYKSNIGKVFKIKAKAQEELCISSFNIVELIILDCKRIDCSRNLLTKLVIPDKCDIIYCYDNQLKEFNYT